MKAFGCIGPNGIWTEHPTNRAYLSFQFDRKLKEFTDRGGTVSLAQRVAAYVAKWGHLLDECTHPVFCHNDLHAGNLLADIAGGNDTAHQCFGF
jgi:aminoglycoside phosphotransferase (APT) family kinase protein